MHAQCALCDRIDQIDDHTLLAKKLKNNRTNSYLCIKCHDRIKDKTLKRHETGDFHLYNSKNHH